MRIFAVINLVLQLLLLVFIVLAAYLAKKGQLKHHCMILRIAVLIQIAAIAGVMLPSMLSYVRLLQEKESLTGVYLQSHQIERRMVEHPVRFVVVASWVTKS